MVKIGVIGAGGRMGRMLIQAVEQNPQTTLAGAIERQGSSLLGVDAGELVNLDKTNVALVDDLAGVIHDIDVLIDFSLPESTAKNLQLCADQGVNMVIGTTGLNPAYTMAIFSLACFKMAFCSSFRPVVPMTILTPLSAQSCKFLAVDSGKLKSMSTSIS